MGDSTIYNTHLTQIFNHRTFTNPSTPHQGTNNPKHPCVFKMHITINYHRWALHWHKTGLNDIPALI